MSTRSRENGRAPSRTAVQPPTHRDDLRRSRPTVLVVVPTLGERPDDPEESLRERAGAAGRRPPPRGRGHPEARDRRARDIAREHGATLVDDPRRGLSAAVNAGWRHGAGRSTTPGSATTTCWRRGGLATLAGLLGAAPGAVVAFGACAYIDDVAARSAVSRAGDWATRVLAWGPDLVPQPASLTRARMRSWPPVSTTSRSSSRWTWTCSCGSAAPVASCPPGGGRRLPVARRLAHGGQPRPLARGVGEGQAPLPARTLGPVTALWDRPSGGDPVRGPSGQRPRPQGRRGRLSRRGPSGRPSVVRAPRARSAGRAAAARSPRPACGCAPRAGRARSCGAR